MSTRLWFLPIAFVAAALWLPGTGRAATIRDEAGLFSDRAVNQARSELERIERETKIQATVETIPSLEGDNIRDVLDRHAKEAQASGLYVLIAKKETKIEVEASRHIRAVMPAARIDAIKEAFLGGFKQKDFDAGLLQGVKAIGQEAELTRADTPVVARARPGGAVARRPFAGPDRVNPAPRGGGGFGLGSLLGIGLLVVGGLFLFRLIGSLLGGGMNRGYGGPGGPMGRPGYGAGGGGGGFMSSLFGGIGGAMAGNWLYDQFSGRHHGGGYAENASYDPGASNDPGAAGADAGPDDWGGGGSVGDWGGGDASGGDAGGGDWGGGGGGDSGGGGGSGGDW